MKATGLKVGWMTRTIWVTFLEGQVHGFHPQTKLPGCDLDITCMCWHLVSEWTWSLMNALKYHWCETGLLSQAVLEHVVSKDFCARDQFYILPRMKKSSYGIVPYSEKISCHINILRIHYFKKKTSTCGSQVGHMWVTSGLFSGSNGSTGVTHNQPCDMIAMQSAPFDPSCSSFVFLSAEGCVIL